MERVAGHWIAAAGILAGCVTADGNHAGAGHGSRVGTVTVDLRATSYNAGEIGQAVLLPQDGSTRIVLRFSGVPAYVTVPVHVYTYIYAASCASLPATPVWALNDRVLADSVSGATGFGAPRMLTISHTAPVAFSNLRSGRYAIALRTAPADGDRPIYCGEL